MASYFFSTISSSQALGILATDSLTFGNVTSAVGLTVAPNSSGVTLAAGSRSVSFGPGLYGLTGTGFGDGSKLFVGGASADAVTGTSGRDQFLGGEGADTLLGLDGDDSLNGGAGDDVLLGGNGADTLDGGAGVDTISFSSALTGVTVSLLENTVSESMERISNFENVEGSPFADILTGDSGGNLLRGGIGGDVLNGLFGDDTLEGGVGADTLSGGAGSDVFGFQQGDSTLAARDVITDWSSDDFLGFGAASGGYQEISSADADSGLASANALIAAGARFVAVQTAAGVVVYADTSGHHTADDAVLLRGASLNDISAANVGAAPVTLQTPDVSVKPPPIPTLPSQPLYSRSIYTTVSVVGNMDANSFAGLLNSSPQTATATSFALANGGSHLSLTGAFTYGLVPPGVVAGPATHVEVENAILRLTVDAPGGLQTLPLGGWLARNVPQDAFTNFFSQDDLMRGSSGDDLIRGYDGTDALFGNGGSDTLFGGAGNDQIFAGDGPTAPAIVGSTYLRGDDGNDYIVGGAGFDDANGNVGNDTISTGDGDDYCVGGKDNDLLFGDGGYDLVYGNLGNDTCVGGDGNDIVRGGQDNDQCFGGAGDDFLSGDKGADTMTGGAGADIFHTFGDAGVDRVTDFNLAEGDRVQLDPGTVYTVSQVGADTVINMTGGGQMILVGVLMNTLTPGWIFGA